MQLLENEITRLSRMRSEQSKLRNSKFAAKKAMGPALAALKIWLAGDYDAFSLLDEPTQLLAEGAQAWSVGESSVAAASATQHLHLVGRIPVPYLRPHLTPPCPHLAVQINCAWALTPGSGSR